MSGSANGNANGNANGSNSGNSKGGGEIAFGTFLGLAALWEVTRRKKNAVGSF
jgi:hypothetical protein